MNPIKLKQYQNFLTEEQCKSIISLGERNLEKAGVLGEQYPNFRVGETHFYNKDFELKALSKIREFVSAKTGIPVENQEPMSLIKYKVGGKFNPHFDSFQPSADYYESVMKQGGQRIKTCLIYLNEEFDGGETEFPKMKCKLKPKTGLMVMWDNTDKNGVIIPESEHAGLPVLSGVKYLVSIWIREKKFENAPQETAEVNN